MTDPPRRDELDELRRAIEADRRDNHAVQAHLRERIDRDHEPAIRLNTFRHDQRDRDDEGRGFSWSWFNPSTWWDNASEETAGRAIKVFRQLAALALVGFLAYAVWAFVTDPQERQHERDMEARREQRQWVLDSLAAVRAARDARTMEALADDAPAGSLAVEDVEINAKTATVNQRGEDPRDP